MTEPKHLYTVEELSAMLHVTPRTIYAWIADGKLAGSRVGRRWLFTEKQVSDFLSASESK